MYIKLLSMDGVQFGTIGTHMITKYQKIDVSATQQLIIVGMY